MTKESWQVIVEMLIDILQVLVKAVREPFNVEADLLEILFDDCEYPS